MDGILLFNKPILWTSHDAVDFIRRRVGQKAVGHAGTLDPLATGLLVMLLGKATKLSQEFSALDKEYSGAMTLGITTDTQDLEGKILRSAGFDNIEEAELLRIFAQFIGKQMQTPPLFSAVRTKGKKLYDWTRRGVAVEPTGREIVISKLELLNFSLPDVHFSLTCSKGTYVRALCDDVGKKLGCGATLSALVRDRIGKFHLKDALNEEQTRKMSLAEIEKYLIRS